MSRAIDRILNALRRAPGLSKEEIAAQAFVSLTTLSGGGYLKDLKEQGLIYVSGWRRNGSGGFTTALYSLGSAADYPRPKLNAENRDAPGMAQLLAVIEKHGPIDYREAARLSGLSINTVKNAGYLEALMAQRKIYISGWRRGRNGPMRAVYESGDAANQPKPATYTPAEKSESYRRRLLAAAGAQSIAAQLRLARRKAGGA